MNDVLWIKYHFWKLYRLKNDPKTSSFLQLIKFDVWRLNSSIFPEFVGGETEDDFHEANPILYDTHIPTSGFQKALLAVGSAVVGLADPWRADMVAVNGEVLG